MQLSDYYPGRLKDCVVFSAFIFSRAELPYPAMDVRPLLPECHGSEFQKLFSTGPGIFRRAGRKENIDGLDGTSCDSLFRSEMVLWKNEYFWQSTREESIVNVPNCCRRCYQRDCIHGK